MESWFDFDYITDISGKIGIPSEMINRMSDFKTLDINDKIKDLYDMIFCEKDFITFAKAMYEYGENTPDGDVIVLMIFLAATKRTGMVYKRYGVPFEIFIDTIPAAKNTS